MTKGGTGSWGWVKPVGLIVSLVCLIGSPVAGYIDHVGIVPLSFIPGWVMAVIFAVGVTGAAILVGLKSGEPEPANT